GPFSGFWTFPVFIPPGHRPGWRPRPPNTAAVSLACLMLSSLAAIVSAGAIAREHLHVLHQFASPATRIFCGCWPTCLRPWVAIVQVVIASRAVCCRFPPADSSDGRRGPWRCSWATRRDGAAYATRLATAKCRRRQLRNAELLQLELEMEIEALSASSDSVATALD
uniref:Os01g0778700 protein n=1 Tax=Macrostomum lignano TaxID=282301 RepID=A0A1I8FDR4_9PLAT